MSGMNPPDRPLVEKFAAMSSYVMALVILMAIMVLVGWQFDLEPLRRPFPNGGTMNPVSAICFILTGITFLIARHNPNHPQLSYVGFAMAGIVSLTGLTKLLSFVGVINLPIDSLMFTDKLPDSGPSPLMAANTSINFFFLGLALIFSRQSGKALREAANVISASMVLIALISLLRYFYHAQDAPGLFIYIRMSLLTALAFCLTGLAILNAHTGSGFMSIVSSQYLGGTIARILLPAAFLVPIILGYLRLLVEEPLAISDEMGVVLLITGIVTLFILLIFFVASVINRSDFGRRKAEEQLSNANKDLEQKVIERTREVAASERRLRAILENSPDAIVITDQNLLAKYQSPSAERMTGFSLDYRRSHPNERYTHPDDASLLNSKMETLLEKPDTPLPFQLRMRTQKGDYIWIEGVMANLLHDKNVEGISFSYRDVTDRKKLEEQRALMARIVDSSDDAIIFKSPEGMIMSWNRGATNIFGFGEDEALGKNMSLIIPNDLMREENDLLAKVRSGQSVEHLETQRVRKDGRRIDVSVSISPVHDQWGKIIGASTIARDVSDKREVEKKLARERTLLRILIDNIPDYIYVKDLESRHIINNAAMVRLLGAASERETLGKSSIDFFGQEVAKQYLEEDKEILLSGVPKSNFEESTITPSGELKFLQTTKIPLRDSDDKIIGLVGISHDITEQKQAELDLKVSKYFLELAQATGHTGHWVLDIADRKKVTWSQEALRILNLPGWELSGTIDMMYRFVHPDDLGQLQLLIENAVRTRSFFSIDHRLLLGDGSIKWLHQQGETSMDGTMPVLISIVQDITGRKQSEDEIRQLNSELEQRVRIRTEQLEASNKDMEAFSYSVSHDLRAPLRIIHGFSKILSEDYRSSLDATAQKTLDAITRNVKKMGQLIDDLLDFSRLGRAEIRTSNVDMNALVNEVLDDLRNSGVAIPNFTIDRLKPAKADLNLIKQVWTNLLTNAIKYSSGKDKPEIHIGTESKDGQPVYFVKDNGAGFDMAYYHKLFGVFQRLHGATEFPGTGVGLAIVHRIITRHGGKVWAEAKVNEGATFYFTLP
jgi:PAS domain S-box-containing protein